VDLRTFLGLKKPPIRYNQPPPIAIFSGVSIGHRANRI
jgi:hypothetical protein